MPGWRRSLSVAAVLLALLPAGAAAQSAGDEQYEDPFGEEQPQGQSTPAPTSAAEPSQSTPAPAAPTQPAPAPAAAPAQAELPRTGAAAALAALLGLTLLTAGVALRAHARRPS